MNHSPIEPRPAAPSTRQPWPRRVLWMGVFLFVALAALELTAQAYWKFQLGHRMFHPSRLLEAYYPELRKVQAVKPRHEDGFYDVLLLGASTLHPSYGPVESTLREELTRRTGRRVRMHNFAIPAQTSRDSRIKYSVLGDARFELVLFYDGLNEVRANNAPPEVFRADYGHYTWYETLNALTPTYMEADFALPYTLSHLARRMRQTNHEERYIGVHEPRADWIQYGATPRSAAAFRENLTAILDMAASRGDQVLLLTFASHVPSDYSAEAFAAKRLDYTLHVSPIEIWGRPDHVVAALAAHNEVIRDLAATRANVWFLDEARRMPGSALHYNDVCHFTTAGAARFAGDVSDFVIPKLPGD